MACKKETPTDTCVPAILDVLMATGSVPTPPNVTSGDIFVTPAATLKQSDSTNRYSFTWFELSVLILCLFGICGNILNILVLTSRRFYTALNRLGSSANYGLVALAVSDLLFCVAVLPTSLLSGAVSDVRDGYLRQKWFLVYRLYGTASIYLFQMTSAWFVVGIALNRWASVVFPLRSKELITKRVTLAVIASIVCASIVASLPRYLMHVIAPYRTPTGDIAYTIKVRREPVSEARNRFYCIWILPIISSFIPAIVLGLCNLKLIVNIKRAYAPAPPAAPLRYSSRTRRMNATEHQKRDGVDLRITVTLVAVFLMYLLLVTPAEIMQYINPYEKWGEMGEIVVNFINVLLLINFSFNFLLYCVVNVSFRKTLKELLQRITCCKTKNSPIYKSHEELPALLAFKCQDIEKRPDQFVTIRLIETCP